MIPPPSSQNGSSEISHACILPAEQFYWAVLDASKITRAGRRQTARQLGYLFENVLPVPIEEVQAAYLRLGDGRYLACGMDKQTLEAQCNGHIHLGPASIPQHITDSVEPHRINLLTGEFEPKSLQRLKARWLVQVAAMVVITTLIATIGMQRRAARCHDTVDQVNDARQQVFRTVGIDGSGAAGRGGQPPELQLTAELRRLRQTRQSPVAEAQLTDVTPLLAALLARWPEQANLQTESVSITPTAITLRGIVPASAGAQIVASSIDIADGPSDLNLRGRVFRGWTMAQPQVTNVRDGVQVGLQLTRTDLEGRR